MEEEIIKSILIYDINNRNKIIGRIVNIPKKETLKNVRSKIKKMNDEDEFLMIGNDNNFDAIDKDIEEDFPLEDILIKENEIYKINIRKSMDKIINKDINNINNNNNKDEKNLEQKNLKISLNQGFDEKNNIETVNVLNYINEYINKNNNKMNYMKNSLTIDKSHNSSIRNNNNMNNLNNMHSINNNNNNNNMNNNINYLDKMNNMNNKDNLNNNIDNLNNMININNNINNMNNKNFMNNANNDMNNINIMNDEINDKNLLNKMHNNENMNNNINNMNNINSMNKINNMSISFKNMNNMTNNINSMNKINKMSNNINNINNNYNIANLNNNINYLNIMNNNINNINNMSINNMNMNNMNNNNIESINNMPNDNMNINNMNNNANNMDNMNNNTNNMNNMNNNINNMNNMNNNINNMNNNIMNNMNDINNNINNINNMINMNNSINSMNNINIMYNNINNFNNNNMMNNMNNNINNMNNMNNMNYNINNMNNNIASINSMNNINNNMNNINNINENINSINKLNLMNDMNNVINNMNNINIMNNNIFDMNNPNNINNIDLNIINLNDDWRLQNLNNLIYNNELNGYLNLKYNVYFKTNNQIKYSMSIYGYIKIKKLLKEFENIIGRKNKIQYLFNDKNIEDIYILNSCLGDFFKNEQNPIIYIYDSENLIDKLIEITFKKSNGEEYLFLFNSKCDISIIKNEFLNNLIDFDYKDDKIQFLYNNSLIRFDYDMKISEFFQNDNNPKIIIDDPDNFIGKKIQVTFKSNHDCIQEIFIHTGTTIGNLIKTYLDKIDEFYSDDYKKTERIEQFMGKIKFYYNNQRIKWYKVEKRNNRILYNITTINDCFKNDNNPEIFVKDENNFLKAITVEFKTTQGNNFNINISNIRTLDHLLTKYLYEIHHFELVDTNDKIAFYYKEKSIIFGDDTILGIFFSNDINPLIRVRDRYNLLSNNSLKKKNIYFDVRKYSGGKKNFIVNYGTTVEQVIKMYLYIIDEKLLIDSYYSKQNIFKLKFYYGNHSYLLSEQSKVENYFLGENARIQVI